MAKRVFLLALLICSLTGTAQVCTGSLGDPVISISFGAGNNPGPALQAGAASSYAYTSKDCPGEGEYAIRNLTSQCNSDSWHTVPFDHTPQDGNNGYYMEINGGDGIDYYVNTLNDLCPNTTYELSFWVMNLSRPGMACDGNATSPDIRYTVETTSGSVLATAKTGAVAQRREAIWNQYTLLFRTAAASVVVRLANAGVSGCGMDFLLDDIALRPCGPSIQATVGNGPTAAKACEGDSARMQLTAAVGAGFLAPAFQWQESRNGGSTWADIPGANALTYLRPSTREGEYLYRLLAGEGGNGSPAQCRVGSNQVRITIEKAPFAQGTNYSYCIGRDVTLFAAGGEKYRWTGPNGFTSDLQSPVLTSIQFKDSGLYTVQVTTSAGCKSSDSTHLFIYSNPVAVASPAHISICEGSSTPLIASGGNQFAWTPSKGLSSPTIPNPVASPADSTTYTVLVTLNGCIDTATVRVHVWKKPHADAGPDKKARRGQTVLLSGAAGGTDVQYFWTPAQHLSSPRALNPSVTVREDATYILHVESNKGCGTSLDEMQIKVYDKISIPNAFSPNGDGINDVWNIDPLELFSEAQTEVFNRYGQLVFSCRGYPKPWNGTRNGQPLPAGTYYYIIDMKNGSPPMTGPVTIVR